MKSIVFPFVAVVGQAAIKKSLIWNIVNPCIGGVLISGEKGTAKSTLVRGICSISPGMKLVELPLNITEDRLIGNINFEHAVKFGEKYFEPGILYKANGNLLYVDEVNLLPDHIVKALLESASSGVNIVEREGISFRHASKFILVGSMNPEEGGLRPQFLDRFGLFVEVKGESDIRKRAEIIRRRIEYEKDPLLFIKKWQGKNEELMIKIEIAKKALNKITITPNAIQLAASIAKEGNCEGHRAEIVIIETARAIAALDSRIALNISDIKEAAKYALPHRVREQQPQQEQQSQQEQQEQDPANHQDKPQEQENNGEQNNDRQSNRQNDNADNYPADGRQEDDPDNMTSGQETSDGEEAPEGGSEKVDDPGEIFTVSKWLSEKSNNSIVKGSGRRSLVKTSSTQGRYVKYRYPIKGQIKDIAIDATLCAAAPYQLYREKNGRAVAIEKSDIRVKVREKRTGNTIMFVVDASGSMGANKRMKAVKGAILSLLNDAYQKRDKVGMIAFREHSAELLLGITRSVELAEKKLAALPTGGRTPLAAGLSMAYDVIKAARIKDKDILPVIVLVSDGKATYSSNGIDAFEEAMNVADKIAADKIKSIVIDADDSFAKLSLAEKIAEAMKADRFEIEELQAQSIVAAVSMSL
ncbi:MAG: magnesium chelatase subunit D family protein [Clostridiales bacterium]|nr:magnesium chelatase subunit D family protein [Clostridiales bacterium]